VQRRSRNSSFSKSTNVVQRNSGMNRRARTVSEGDSWSSSSTAQTSSGPKQNQPYAGRHSAGGGGTGSAASGSNNFGGRKRTTSSGSSVVSVQKKSASASASASASDKPKNVAAVAATTAMLNEVSAKISRSTSAVSK
jgi:hypothetical protein